MEKKMETTITYWGYMGENGKENGNYYSILGLYRRSWKRKWQIL